MNETVLISRQSMVTGDLRQSRSSRLLREGILLLAGLLAGAYLHYNASVYVMLVLQIIVLYAFYKSPVNYPWIMIMYFVSFNPGGFFSLLHGEALVLISSSATGSLTFQLMFILLAWLKVGRSQIPVFFQRRYLLVIAYILLQVPIFGVESPFLFLRMLIVFSWLILVPRLLKKQEEFDGLFYLIFLFNAFLFLTNLFQILTGIPPVKLFNAAATLGAAYDPDLLVRTAYGIQFAHMAVFGALIYLTTERAVISTALAYSGLLLGFLNIVFSATRGWIFGTLFMLLVYSFFLIPRLFRNLMVVIPVVIVSVFAVWQIPIIRNQVQKAYYRTLYTENLLNPDLNAETTDIGRIQKGAPVMRSFRESPFLGHGFGGRGYTDGHAGNQSMLANFGIFGYLLFVNLWLGFVFKLARTSRFLSRSDPESRLMILCVIAFLGVFMIHSTSAGFLHPSAVLYGVFWYSLIFAYGNYLVNKRRGIVE